MLMQAFSISLTMILLTNIIHNHHHVRQDSRLSLSLKTSSLSKTMNQGQGHLIKVNVLSLISHKCAYH